MAVGDKLCNSPDARAAITFWEPSVLTESAKMKRVHSCKYLTHAYESNNDLPVDNSGNKVSAIMAHRSSVVDHER